MSGNREPEGGDRPAGAHEPTATSVAAGGHHEPRRRAEWTGGILLVVFAAILVLVRTHWSPGAEVDAWLVADTHSFALTHPWMVTLSIRVSYLGSTWVIVALSVLLGLALYLSRRPRAAVFVLATELLGAVLNVILKDLLARARPVVTQPVAIASGASFPSGHAMNSAICYTLIISALLFSGLVRAHAYRTVAAVFLGLMPILIGVSRVTLDVHFASDVLGGWIMGVAWVALATAIVRPWRRDPSAQERPPARAPG